MDNFDEVYPIILEEYQRGATEGEAFDRICNERGLNLSSSSTANWTDRIRNYELEQRIVVIRCKLVHTISSQYLKYRYAIVHLQNWRFSSDLMLSDRTLLSVRRSSFVLLDTFNGDSRNIQSEVQQALEFRIFSSVLVDNGRVLCGAKRGRESRLYLLKFDFDALTYSIINEHALDFDFDLQAIILDSDDNTKFVLYTEFPSMHKGRLVNNQIHVEEQQMDFDFEFLYCKLLTDQLFAVRLRLLEGEDGWDFDFTEYNIGENPAREVNVWRIVDGSILASRHPDFPDTSTSAYVWSKEKLYVSCLAWLERSFSILTFDAKIQKWFQPNFTGFGNVSAMEIDEDEILTVSSFGNDEGGQQNKTVYRLPMKKPDKLRYLAWGTIRRGNMFFGSDIYEKFFPLLPYNSEFRSIFEEL